MENVNLKASPETRAQILQLIALEQLANGKDYTIKSYLEHLVSLAAHGNFDEAGKLQIEIQLKPVDFRMAGPELRAVGQLDSYRLRPSVSPEDADNDGRLFDQDAVDKLALKMHATIAEINAADLSSVALLDQFRLLYLGRKGRLADLFDSLASVPAEQRRKVGQLLNEIKQGAQMRFDQAQAALENNE